MSYNHDNIYKSKNYLFYFNPQLGCCFHPKVQCSPFLLKLIEQSVSLIIVKTLIAKVLGPLVVYDDRRALVPGDLWFFPTYLFYQFARCQCRMGLQL